MICHPIVSFQFSDDQQVAISVETRMAQGQSYSTVRGFFKKYDLIYIVADERDVARRAGELRGRDLQRREANASRAADLSHAAAKRGDVRERADAGRARIRFDVEAVRREACRERNRHVARLLGVQCDVASLRVRQVRDQGVKHARGATQVVRQNASLRSR